MSFMKQYDCGEKSMFRKVISIALETCVVICAVVGIALTAVQGMQCFLYFTMLSMRD